MLRRRTLWALIAALPLTTPQCGDDALEAAAPIEHPQQAAFASVAALCAENDRVVLPVLRERYGEDAFPETERCRESDPIGLDAASFQDGPFTGATFVEIDDVTQHHRELVLQTANGWVRSGVRAGSSEHMDPGCLHAETERVEDVRVTTARTGRRVVVLRIVQRETTWGAEDAQQNGSVARELAYACHVDEAQRPSCEGPVTLATAREPLPRDFSDEMPPSSAFELVLDTLPWVDRKRAVLSAEGNLRAEP